MSGFKKRYELRSESLIEFYDKLGLTRKDGLKMYSVFEKIDADNSGSIRIDEFCDHFDLHFTPFAEAAFLRMDTNKEIGNNQALDFPEFFVGTYASSSIFGCLWAFQLP